MKVDEVMEILGMNQSQLADFLGITKQSVSDWRTKMGGNVPEKQMYKLRWLTRGKIKVTPRDYMK
jgi:DNA-binding transcriptional regulator YiaG